MAVACWGMYFVAIPITHYRPFSHNNPEIWNAVWYAFIQYYTYKFICGLLCTLELVVANRNDSMCFRETDSVRERASVMYCMLYSVYIVNLYGQSSVEQTRDLLYAAFHELSKLQTVHLQH